MPKEPEPHPESDPGLDSATELVARILGFITSDRERFSRFLHRTSFQPCAIQDALPTPHFMRAVLDAVLQDVQLINDLHTHAQIGLAVVEQARAIVDLPATAEVVQRSEKIPEASAVRAKVEQQLRALLRLARENRKDR
ncbi:DUF3572 family protein [Microvirga roseola]|uniref:DUF3572 family protein n=1 Tax=Microvirga roseola TaxID=2883126 RepID=UPI0038993450